MSYVYLALFLVLIGLQYWPFAWPMNWLKAIPTAIESYATKTDVLPADIDVTDLAALKTVKARFVRLNCPEGIAACTVQFDHFFHEAAK